MVPSKERPGSAGAACSVPLQRHATEKEEKPEFFDLGARVQARRPKGLYRALGFTSARASVESAQHVESKAPRSEGLSEVVKGHVLGGPLEEDGDAEDRRDGVDLRTRIPVLVANLDLPPFPEADASFPHFQKTAQSLDRNSAMTRARLNGSLSHYERQVEKNPNSFNGLVNLACCFIISHKFREALELLQRARRLHSDKVNVLLNIIICHVQLRQFNAARKLIDSSLKGVRTSQRERTLLLRFRALCHFRSGEFQNATQIFKDVARVEPQEGPPREPKQSGGGQFGGIEDDDAKKTELKRDLFSLKYNLPQSSDLPSWGRRHSFTDDQSHVDLDGNNLVKAQSGWQPLRRVGLEMLLSQMDRTVAERDMDLCGNLCASLYFFKRLELAQAVVLLEHADVRLFQAGEYVVKQHDFSDYMYVILMGSVVIDMKLPELGDHPVVVNTLSDGQVFGEMSYFTSGATQRARREASVIAQEQSYLLRADPAVYHEVMKRNVDQDQTQKLAVLCRVPFFDFCTNYQLAPLAAHTETLSLRLGDRLVHQGQYSEGCYIIAEGLCTLLLSEEADPNTGARDNESPVHTVEPWEPPLIPDARITAVNAGTNREGAQHEPRLAIPPQSVPLVYGRLGPGQFVGLGALSDVRGRCAYPSQVTVQVNSSVAKVYMVTRKSLLHLPEASMNGVITRLAGVSDPINPTQKVVNEAIRAHHQWCKDKRRNVFAEMTAR